MTNKANSPHWDGQELYNWDGLLVFIYKEDLHRVTLVEYPGDNQQDIYYITKSTFYSEASSATPEELEDAGI